MTRASSLRLQILLAVICCFMVSRAVLAADESRPIAIRGATILTMTNGTIENGTVILRDGKIENVGKDIAVPADAEVIDARGKFVTPGLVDPHSHIGVYSVPEVTAHDDGNEMTDPVTAQVRSEDAINTDDPEIARGVSGGVTTVQILPGSGNNVGGWATIVKLNGAQTVEEMKFPNAPPSMKWAWGENQKSVYRAKDKAPTTLMGEAAIVRQKLYDARNYTAKWKAWEEGDKKEAPPERDLQLESLAQVLDGKVRVNAHSYQVNHFEALFRISDEFGFQIASLHHALDAYMIAPEIARRKIGVVTFADLWGYKVEAWDAIPQNAYILWKQGVTVAFHTDNPVIGQRYYIAQAAFAVHYGLPDDVALQAVTINPARILGIDRWVGSIEPGKHADVVIWDGYPIELRSRAEKVFIDGQLVYTLDDGFLPWKGRPVGQFTR
ncbi:MAG TPA: amidohydrolase [Terriglobia bacterium]|nr:amidohydrolase [Terriglobia bacterium]